MGKTAIKKGTKDQMKEMTHRRVRQWAVTLFWLQPAGFFTSHWQQRRWVFIFFLDLVFYDILWSFIHGLYPFIPFTRLSSLLLALPFLWNVEEREDNKCERKDRKE